MSTFHYPAYAGKCVVGSCLPLASLHVCVLFLRFSLSFQRVLDGAIHASFTSLP